MTKITISGATIIDGRGSEPLVATVHVEDGVIRAVEAGNHGPTSDDSLLIEGDGKTLLPGFIDCHVHLSHSGEADPHSRQNQPDTELAINTVRNAMATLQSGVTTARDCGAGRANLPAILSGLPYNSMLPRVLGCGQFITTPGGHFAWEGIQVSGPEQARAAVRQVCDSGSTWIKVMATGGVLSAGTQLGAAAFTREEMDALVDEAASLGMGVAAHAIGEEGIAMAVAAGVSTVEHGTYIDEHVAVAMREKGIAHVPTLSASHHVVSHGEHVGIPRDIVQKAAAVGKQSMVAFERSLRHRVSIAAGTDAGTPFNYHGGFGTELELMVAAGATPLQALMSATGHAAKALRISDKVGTIESGKQADLVLVDGDPLADISVCHRPAHVIRSGRLVPHLEFEDLWETVRPNTRRGAPIHV